MPAESIIQKCYSSDSLFQTGLERSTAIISWNSRVIHAQCPTLCRQIERKHDLIWRTMISFFTASQF